MKIEVELEPSRGYLTRDWTPQTFTATAVRKAEARAKPAALPLRRSDDGLALLLEAAAILRRRQPA